MAGGGLGRGLEETHGGGQRRRAEVFGRPGQPAWGRRWRAKEARGGRPRRPTSVGHDSRVKRSAIAKRRR